MNDPLSWIIIGICLIGSFFFSASETALSLCNKFKMQIEADKGSKRAKLVLHVTSQYDKALTAVLIGNNIVAVAISAISTILFYKYLNGIVAEQYISIISSIVMAFVVYILGDTLPKTIAKLIPDTLSLAFIYPIYVFMIIVYPIAIIFEGMVKLLNKLFKNKEDNTFTEEDFQDNLEMSEEEGIVDEEQADIIQSALEFGDTKVKDVLTKKKDIFAIDLSQTKIKDIPDIICSTSYSRIPVIDGDFDNIVGILIVKTYVDNYLKKNKGKFTDLLQKPYIVDSTIDLIDLFNGFKTEHTHLAMVKGKNNKIIGMVTMEDILEELVEDIAEPNKRGNKKWSGNI